MTNYNGWTNYATWRVNLEMFDGFDAQLCGFKGEDKNDLYNLSLTLKEYAIEMLEADFQGNNGKNMPLALSYALAFIEDVNWREIAAHMLDVSVEA